MIVIRVIRQKKPNDSDLVLSFHLIYGRCRILRTVICRITRAFPCWLKVQFLPPNWVHDRVNIVERSYLVAARFSLSCHVAQSDQARFIKGDSELELHFMLMIS